MISWGLADVPPGLDLGRVLLRARRFSLVSWGGGASAAWSQVMCFRVIRIQAAATTLTLRVALMSTPLNNAHPTPLMPDAAIATRHFLLPTR